MKSFSYIAEKLILNTYTMEIKRQQFKRKDPVKSIKTQILEVENDLKNSKKYSSVRVRYLISHRYMTFSEALRQVRIEKKEFQQNCEIEIVRLNRELAKLYTPKYSPAFSVRLLGEAMTKAHMTGNLGGLD